MSALVTGCTANNDALGGLEMVDAYGRNEMKSSV